MPNLNYPTPIPKDRDYWRLRLKAAIQAGLDEADILAPEDYIEALIFAAYEEGLKDAKLG